MKTILSIALLSGFIYQNTTQASDPAFYNTNGFYYSVDGKKDGHADVKFHSPLDKYITLPLTNSETNKSYELKIGESKISTRVVEDTSKTTIEFTEKKQYPEGEAILFSSADYDLSGRVINIIESSSDFKTKNIEYSRVISPDICEELIKDEKIVEKMQACNGLNEQMNKILNKMKNYAADTLSTVDQKLKILSEIKMPDEVTERNLLLQRSTETCKFLKAKKFIAPPVVQGTGLDNQDKSKSVEK